MNGEFSPFYPLPGSWIPLILKSPLTRACLNAGLSQIRGAIPDLDLRPAAPDSAEARERHFCVISDRVSAAPAKTYAQIAPSMLFPLRVLLAFGLSVSVTLTAGVRLVHAGDRCAEFTWDVRHERALFGKEPQALTGGQTLSGSPTLAADRLYQLRLRGQSEIMFLRPPAKKPGGGEAYAGLARLRVDMSGVYRIALDQPVWVDVIVNGTVVPAKEFQGRPGCNAPHKIVEFVLPARAPITLQFSGSSAPTVKVTVTRSPAARS